MSNRDEISIGDPYGYKNISSTDEFAVHTPTQWAISPRIGISHPITDKTVLHFMYGHFNQRPSWQKMTNTPFMQLRPLSRDGPHPHTAAGGLWAEVRLLVHALGRRRESWTGV